MEIKANVEILVIGNEILTGDILDTNTNWLCKMVNGRGGEVSRVTVLPDNLEIIAEAVRAAVERGVDIVITTGGLGPTVDDLTLQAVGLGTDRGLELHEPAREMIRSQYDHFFEKKVVSKGGLTPAREKMAYLPKGAEPLVNSPGTAPGVLLDIGQTSIISVPGVPTELKAIIGETLKDFFDERLGKGERLTRRVLVICGDESSLEPVLSRITNKYPEIYTKSLANPIGMKRELEVMMTMIGTGDRQEFFDNAFLDMCSSIREIGFTIKESE